jgi:hypothetical protein
MTDIQRWNDIALQGFRLNQAKLRVHALFKSRVGRNPNRMERELLMPCWARQPPLDPILIIEGALIDHKLDAMDAVLFGDINELDKIDEGILALKITPHLRRRPNPLFYGGCGHSN